MIALITMITTGGASEKLKATVLIANGDVT